MATGGVANNSVDVAIHLGKGAFGQQSSVLRIKSDGTNSAIYKPDGLRFYQGSLDARLIRDPVTSAKLQVKTPSGLAKILPIGTQEYNVEFYESADIGTQNANGTYNTVPGAVPESTWNIKNPTPSNLKKFRVTENRDGRLITSDYSWNGTGWTLTTDGGKRVEDRKLSGNIETHTIKSVVSGTTTIRYQEVKEFTSYAWGKELTKETIGSMPNALITSREYYVSGSGIRKPKWVEYPSGSWETYAYDAKGRIARIVTQHKNNPRPSVNPTVPPADPSAQEELNRVTTIAYNDISPPATTTVVTLGSKTREISRSYEVVKRDERHYIQCQTPGATYFDASNLKEVVWTVPLDDPQFPGETLSTKRTDGTMSFYSYSITNNEKTTTIRTGVPNAQQTDVIDGVKTVVCVDRAGNNKFTKNYDIAAEPAERLLTSRVTLTTDPFGRPERVQLIDATIEETIYGCCGIERQTDQSGVTTEYEYDDYRRVKAVTTGGVRTEYEYDAVGRLVKTTRKGTGAADIVINLAGYDTASRLISSTNALNQVTRFSESKNGSLTLKTTAYPNGSTRIETFNSDGTLASIDGTAVHPRLKYEYDFDAGGAFTKEIRLVGTSETEWVKQYRNMLDDVVKVAYPPNSTGQTPVSESFYYPVTGKLGARIDPDGVLTLFNYDATGYLSSTCIDSNRNGEFNPGLDRISHVKAEYGLRGSTPVRRETRRVSDWVNGAEALVTTGIDEISTDGRDSWSTRVGQTTRTRIDYPQPPGQKLVTETFPDLSTRVSRYVDGRLESITRKDPSGSQITKTSYLYDPHGRLWKSIDARDGETVYEYFDDDRLKSVTTPAPGQGQTVAQKTSYAYDDLNPQGRTETITLPDQTTVVREYFLTGELKKTSGSRITPVAYTYDDQGRVRTMTTWQAYGTANPGSAVTTWNYSLDRGFLSSKLNNLAKGPSYEYYDSGKLKTRTWARGLRTRYTYNHLGELWNIDHGEDGAIDRNFQYDLRSQLKTVTDSTGVQTLIYEDDGQLRTETYSGASPLAGIRVESAYGTYGRRDTLGIFQGATPIVQHGFGYDSSSRLQTVSGGNFLATYQYLPNSQLAEYLHFDVSGSRVMTTKKIFNNLDALKEIKSYSSSGTEFAKHVYDYSDANQRRKVTLADGSYWDYLYDSLGQLRSGKKYWTDGTPVAGQHFEYTFDTIGNRRQTRAGGDEGGANLRVSDYTPDTGLLNRYAQRTVPGAVDVIGSAHPDAFITINGQSPSRKESYYRLELPVNNASAAAYQSVTVNAIRNHAGTGGADVTDTKTGNIFAPHNPEIFSAYDDDGNLQADGRWTYTWDAENQLYEMVETSTAIPALERKKLRFAYDYLGRRVQKTVLRAQDNVVLSQVNFVYHGGNLLAELNGLSANALLRSYVWGLDLSGTGQGAGGVGGLLAVRDSLGAYHSVAYDGNGNVSALVVANGTISAEYHYGPFGELIGVRGSFGSANPFRYSSKYSDDESDLVYFGFRYYSPSMGRWLNRDPIGELGGLNLYGYVGNNPVNFYDPYGLAYGDWWDVRSYFNDGWLRYYYTGDPNASDEVYDGATDAAGGYIHCNSPLRGAYGFAGVQSPKGKSLVPGSHIHGEALGLAGWDVSDGGWGGAIGAVGYGPASVGGEYIFGGHGAPIVLGDLSSLPIGGFITEGNNGLQVGLYLHRNLGKYGTVGGGFYWDVDKLGNYLKGDYWKGRMPCECE